MPSDNLTPSESAILLILLAEAREVSNLELNERFGVTLTGASRNKLNALGYVEPTSRAVASCMLSPTQAGRDVPSR